jgi:hypothetical protein
MFSFTTKKKKRNNNRKNKNKNNNNGAADDDDDKRISINIEEIDTPDTPTNPAATSPQVVKWGRTPRTRRRDNNRNRNRKYRAVSQRTPTPYPRTLLPPASPPIVLSSPSRSSHDNSGNSGKEMKIKSEGDMILFFIEMLNTVKLYHWKTRSFATHKATDELYDDLNKYVDEFVEVMLGYKGGIRANIPRSSVKLNDFKSSDQFKHKLEEYKKTLISYTRKLDPSTNSDLLNIRDELLATLNKTTYLLSFI